MIACFEHEPIIPNRVLGAGRSGYATNGARFEPRKGDYP